MSQSQSQSTSTPSRCRVANSRISKEQLSPKPQVTAANNKTRPKSVPSPDLSNNNSKDCSSKVRRSQLLSPNKSKSGEQEVAGSQVAYPSVNRPLIVEQFSKPRRQVHAPLHSSTWKSGRRNQEECNNKEDLLEKPQSNLALIQDLQSQVLALKAELDKAHALNFQLDSLNKKLLQDLAALQPTTQSSNQQSLTGECQNPKFKDIQKLIANKLQHSTVNREVINGPKNTFQAHQPPSAPKLLPKTGVVERQVTANCSLPPPPPPPPPLRPTAKALSAPTAPAVVELYHSLRNQEEGRDTARLGTQYKPPAMTVHSSIVGEIQNRSAHLLAIKEDIKKKGDFINGLIHKVLAAAYTDIEDVLKFTDWLDTELSTLADERAVLKHFKWPERKADAIREAAIEYRGLKLVENEISSYEDDENIPCGTALKKMVLLLDKSEKSSQRLVKLRNSVMRSYQDLKIPTDWMLDSGIMSKIKQGSLKLAKMYMNRVKVEVEQTHNSDKESSQECLLLEGVHFIYRAHQFAGGLDTETLCAFEEMRRRVRVPGHLLRSRELLAAVTS